MRTAIIIVTLVCAIAGVTCGTTSSCDEAWAKAKECSKSFLEKTKSSLGVADNLWKNLCQMKLDPSCGLKMTVSSGLLHYDYHFMYNSEKIDIEDKDNIETQKLCNELLESSSTSN